MGIVPWLVATFFLFTHHAGWGGEKEEESFFDPPIARKERLRCQYFLKKSRSYKMSRSKFSKKSPSPHKSKVLNSESEPALESFFDISPMEIDRHILSFLSTRKLLEIRRVDKKWKDIAEDIIKKDRHPFVFDLEKFNLAMFKKNPGFQLKLHIEDIKIINFHKGYQEKFDAFMKVFTYKDQVKCLSFKGNRFGEKRLKYLIPYIEQFKNLEVLDFSHNNIETPLLPYFSYYLTGLTHLHLIDFQYNLITSFATIPWVQYLNRASELHMVLCSHQQEIVWHDKKRQRKQLDKVIVPSQEGTLTRLIFKDTPIELDGIPNDEHQEENLENH